MSNLNIQKKMKKVIESLHGVKQQGFNQYQKYTYTRQEDVINAIRPLLVEQNLLILSQPTEEETIIIENKVFCKVTLEFEIIDLDTGDNLKMKFKGHGVDNGDKAIYKAYTGAEKYFYVKNFLIGTPNDDAEYEEDKKSQQNKIINNKNYNNQANKNNNGNTNYNQNNNGNTNYNQNNNNTSNNNPANYNNQNNNSNNNTNNQTKDNNNPNEKTIDIRLQEFLFIAAKKNEEIVFNAIKKFGYTSVNNITITDYKKILEVIKADVNKMRGNF